MNDSLGEEKRHKTKIIAIRVTEEEFLKIGQFASSFNLPMGMYVRMVSLLGYLPIVVTKSDLTVSDAVMVSGLRQKSARGGSAGEHERHRSRAVSK